MLSSKLIERLSKPNDLLIAVDLDGTICEGEFWDDFHAPKVNEAMKELMWTLYRKGAHLVIYTARQPKHYPITHAWLIAHEIPFHGIVMCMKPGADVYIDDKSINTDDMLAYEHEEV